MGHQLKAQAAGSSDMSHVWHVLCALAPGRCARTYTHTLVPCFIWAAAGVVPGVGRAVRSGERHLFEATSTTE